MDKKIYSFSYDLDSDRADYSALYAEIGKFNNCQCLESTWLIATELPIKDVAASLEKALKVGDRYFIQELFGEDYWGRAYKRYGVWDWIKKMREPSQKTLENDVKAD